MGKRSRKRGGDPTRRPAPEAARARTTTQTAAPSRRARLDELPPAPWAPFPLVEICVLLGLVLMGIGLFGGGDRKVAFVLTGVALASLAGLEQAVREHFAGYRSHTTLLAGVAGVLVLVGGSVAEIPREVVMVAGVIIFTCAWYVLRRTFQRRTGGLGFRA